MGDQVQTVPVFAPDGTLGDIPAEKLHDAVAAGFKPGVTMKSPDGKLGVIPSDRYTEAAKSGLTVVPFQQQETQHEGFWKLLGADLYGMAKGAANPKKVLLNAATMGLSGTIDAVKNIPSQVEHYEEQKKAGYSLPYRIATPAAENLGVNVSGMEQSAREGDTAGVAGHASAVPTVMAATAGIAKAAPVISDAATAAASKAAKAVESVRDITPKQVAQGAGVATGAGLGHGTLSIPGAYYGAKSFGHIAEAVLGKDRANAPIFARAPELSLDNITDALAETIANDRARFTQSQAGALGKLPETGAKPAAQTGEALASNPISIGPEPPKGGVSAPRFTQSDRAAARSLLEDALKHNTSDVIDSAITDPTANARTKAKVDIFLNKGNVKGAEAALDFEAKRANPSWQPPERQVIPSTRDIRAKVNAEAKFGKRADELDTHALQQEMNADLQMHQWSAESEARREFIARNSTDYSKTGVQRVSGATPDFYPQRALPRGKNAQAGASPTDDLTDLLQKSLDEARKRQKGK